MDIGIYYMIFKIAKWTTKNSSPDWYEIGRWNI